MNFSWSSVNYLEIIDKLSDDEWYFTTDPKFAHVQNTRDSLFLNQSSSGYKSGEQVREERKTICFDRSYMITPELQNAAEKLICIMQEKLNLIVQKEPTQIMENNLDDIFKIVNYLLIAITIGVYMYFTI